jgi:nucleoside phosphorylase
MIEARIADLVDRAFDYRGYVTLRRSDGSELVGFVYDRGASHLELLDQSATRRMRVPLAEIADIAFTGEDAARKSQEIWERRQGTLEPRETPAHGEWAEAGPILVLVALEQELRAVGRALDDTPRAGSIRGRLGGNDVVTLASGMGKDPELVLAEWQPRMLVSCGFCGGLDPELMAGDLVLATAVRAPGGEVLTAPEPARLAAAAMLEGLRYRQGEVIQAASVVTTVDEKRELASRSGALAVDMESYVLGLEAAEAGIPWLALRAVVDPAGSPLPEFAREAHRDYLWPALKYALKGPRAAARLIRLARDFRLASAALTAGLRRLGPALAAVEARQ